MNAEKTIWPESWPHPDDLFGGLHDRIISIHSRQLLAGAQIIVRFKNGYGANILHNRLEEGLSEIAFLKFFGDGINDFDFIHDGPVTDLSWCFNHAEIFNLCDSISKLGEQRQDMKGARHQM
jgi:hypothetical protein